MTRLSLLVLLAACGGPRPASETQAPRPPAPRPRPTSSRALPGYPPPEEPLVTACRLTGGWGPDQPHELRFRRGGRTFATINSVERAALSLGEDPASPFVELRSPHLRLWGVVVADQLLIHPAHPILLDGYLAPGPTGILRWLGARGEPARVEVVVPSFVKPVTPPRDEVRCGDLTIDEVEFDPREAIDAPEGKSMVLVADKPIRLAREPTGPAVAELRFEDQSGPGVELIERSGDRARIAIPHGNLNPAENVMVIGWVAASVVVERATGFGGSWGSGGDRIGSLPRPRKGWRMVTCAHEVPLVVELEGEQHLVGGVSSGVSLEIPPDADTASHRLIEIAVRSRQLELADDTRMLTRGEAVADCSPALAPEQ